MRFTRILCSTSHRTADIAPTAGAQSVRLKIATMAPDGTIWMKGLQKAADEVEKRTDGRVRFRFYPGRDDGHRLGGAPKDPDRSASWRRRPRRKPGRHRPGYRDLQPAAALPLERRGGLRPQTDGSGSDRRARGKRLCVVRFDRDRIHLPDVRQADADLRRSQRPQGVDDAGRPGFPGDCRGGRAVTGAAANLGCVSPVCRPGSSTPSPLQPSAPSPCSGSPRPSI